MLLKELNKKNLALDGLRTAPRKKRKKTRVERNVCVCGSGGSACL